MQMNTFTNPELSSCLEVLYGPKSGAFFSHGFTCVESTHPHLKNAIIIKGSEEDMKKVISKIETLKLKCWTNNQPMSEMDYFHSASEGKSRVTLTNESAVNLFKEALQKDLLADEAALNSYTLRREYRKASL